jgi:hypothetical protein
MCAQNIAEACRMHGADIVLGWKSHGKSVDDFAARLRTAAAGNQDTQVTEVNAAQNQGKPYKSLERIWNGQEHNLRLVR